MRRLIPIAAVCLLVSASAFAADQTWTGMISDSKCGASHKAMTEHNANLTDSACTKACVKGGAKFVFASQGKVYTIANQNDADLATYAGENVMLTGEMKGNTITVSKVEKKS